MKKLKIKLLIILLLNSFLTFSQEGFEDDTTDVPSADIDSKLVILFFGALFLGFYTFKKHIKVNK